MRKYKLINILLVAVLVLQAAAEVFTAVVLLRLKMLPDLFVILLLVALALFLGTTGGLMFLRGKRPVSAARKIIACILALLFVLGCGLVTKLGTDAYNAIHTVTQPITTNTRNVYVFVRSDDPAQSLTDAAGYTFGYIGDYDVEHTENAFVQLEEKLGASVSRTALETGTDLASALLDGQVDAVVMNGVTVALLLEQEGYEDFTEKVRILETMALSSLVDPVPTEPTEPPVPEQNITNTPFCVYISGSDTRSGILDVSRSDVNILVVVNPQTKQILLLNTPRDYYVKNPAGNGALDKLTHCGLYGVECSMGALEELYGTKIDYYGQINFTGFKTLVDAVGGITVYSDEAFKANKTYISVGENTLDGSQALDFARERYHVSGGDRGRGNNQMKVIKAVIEKMTTGTTVISNYSSILASLEGMFSTSVTMDEIGMLVKMQLTDMSAWNIQTFAVSGEGGSMKTYSMPGTRAYVMFEDEDMTAYASKLIEKVYAGEILKPEDMTYPQP